ncbi:MAG TPA: ATP-binding protein [Flavobacterium sp.]|jgi:signal transduction histidine kinase
MISYRSLFLLLSAAALLSCNRGREATAKTSLAAIYTDSASLENLPRQTRLWHSAAAYRYSLKETPTVIWKAFSVRNALLKSHSSEESSAFVSDYIQDSQRRSDTLNSANGYFELARIYDEKGQADDAFKYYNASKLKYELLNDSLQVAEKLLYIADLYRTFNDYIGMEAASTEAMSFLPRKAASATDSIYTSIVHNNFGWAYAHLEDRSNALHHYQLAAGFTQDKLAAGIVNNNMAVLYMDSGHYSQASAILESLLLNDVVQAHPETRSKVLGNLGYCYFKAGRSDGIRLLQQSVEIRQVNGDRFGLIAGYFHLSDYFTDSDIVKARGFAHKAYDMATQLKSTDDRLESLKKLRKITTGNEREHYSDLFIRIQDSIVKVRQKARNQFAKFRYDARQAQADNLELKAQRAEQAFEIERKKRINFILYTAIFFGLAGSIVLYLFMRKRHRLERMREGYNAEKRIAKKVHDELANDIFNMMTFAQTQDLSDDGRKELLMNNLDSVYARTRDISRENSRVDTGAAFPVQLRQMLSEYKSDHVNVIVQGLDEIAWGQVSADTKIAVWRTLQELMINMRKHSQASLSAIRFKIEKGKISIDYSDNGCGMTVGTASRKNGLQNVENRIDAIGGAVTFESEPGKGVRITLILPV